MDGKTSGVNHGAIFSSLVVLALVSVGLTLLHLSPAVNNLAIFAIAFVMAGLVVAQYMGLRLEGAMVIWIVAVPVILFAIIVVAMMPDIAHVHVPFLEHKG